MITKFIEEVKEAESIAEKIIKEAEKEANKIIKAAQMDSDILKEKTRKKVLEEGKLMLEKEEELAKKEAINIIDNSIKTKDEIYKRAAKKIDNAVTTIVKKVVEE